MFAMRYVALMPITQPLATGASPRRRDARASRAAIEAAARALFAARGYALTGVRDIAAQAGVNSSLVGRYFGTKEALFRTVVRDALDMRPLLAGPRDRFGHHVVAIFDHARIVPSPLAMILLSMGDPDACEIAGTLGRDAIVAPLAAWLGGQDAILRARQLNMLWSGYLTHAQLLPNGDEAGEAALAAWLASATQAIVDGPTFRSDDNVD